MASARHQAILQRRAPLAQQRLLAIQLLADPVNAHHPHKNPPADTGPTHTSRLRFHDLQKFGFAEAMPWLDRAGCQGA